MEEHRSFSIQLSDLYTHIIGYVGTRTTGNVGGAFLIARPGWNGDVPQGLTKVIPTERELASAGDRTQVFNPDDLENVKKIQAGDEVKPFSAFLGTPAPEAAEAIAFIETRTAAQIKTRRSTSSTR